MNTLVALSLNVSQATRVGPTAGHRAKEDDPADDSTGGSATTPFGHVLSAALGGPSNPHAPGQGSSGHAKVDEPTATLSAEVARAEEKGSDPTETPADLAALAGLASSRSSEPAVTTVKPSDVSHVPLTKAVTPALPPTTPTAPTGKAPNPVTSAHLPADPVPAAPAPAQPAQILPVSNVPSSAKTTVAPLSPGAGGSAARATTTASAEDSRAPAQPGPAPVVGRADEGGDPHVPEANLALNVPAPTRSAAPAGADALALPTLESGSRKSANAPPSAHPASSAQVPGTTASGTGSGPAAPVGATQGPTGLAGTGAPAAPVATAPPVADQVAEAITAKASLVQRGGTTDIYLRLNPPELGSVNLHLRAAGQTLMARVVVSGDTARAAIENQLPQLRARLAEAGITLGGFDVAQQRQDPQPEPQHPELPGGEQPGGRNPIGTFAETESSPRPVRGLLDVLV